MKKEEHFQIAIEVWGIKETLTLNEIAALWAGEIPPEIWIDEEDHPGYDRRQFPTRSFSNLNLFETVLSNIRNAVALYRHSETENGSNKTKGLKPSYFYPSSIYNDDGQNTGESDPCYPDPNRTTVNKTALVRWAIETDQSPAFLKKDIDKLAPPFTPDASSAPYLNPKHEYYSIELKTAIEVWMHFFEEGGYDKDHVKTAKQQINAYLDKEHCLGSTQKERIAILINPKKGGPNKRQD